MAILSNCFFKIRAKIPFIMMSMLVNQLSISRIAYLDNYRTDHEKVRDIF